VRSPKGKKQNQGSEALISCASQLVAGQITAANLSFLPFHPNSGLTARQETLLDGGYDTVLPIAGLLRILS